MLITGGNELSCEESLQGHWEPQEKVKQGSLPGRVPLEASLGLSNKGTVSLVLNSCCAQKQNDV